MRKLVDPFSSSKFGRKVSVKDCKQPCDDTAGVVELLIMRLNKYSKIRITQDMSVVHAILRYKYLQIYATPLKM